MATSLDQGRPKVLVPLSWIALVALVVMGAAGSVYWLGPTWMTVSESRDGAGKTSPPTEAPRLDNPEALFPTRNSSTPQPGLLEQAIPAGPAVSKTKRQEARLAATLSLLQLWGGYRSTTVGQLKGHDLRRLVRKSGLQSSRLPAELGLLERLDYPCLLEWTDKPGGPRHTVVLTGLSSTEATILDPWVGRRAVSRADLLQHTEGEALVFWKALPGIKVPLRARKGKNPVTTALQQSLKEQRLLAGPVTGVYDSATRAAVAKLQTEYGIKTTGVFGVRSYIALSKRVSGAQVPSLRASPNSVPGGVPPRD